MAATLIAWLAAALLAAAQESAPDATPEACAQQAWALVDELYGEGGATRESIVAIAARGRPLAARAGGATPLLLEFELASAALHAGEIALAGEWLATARPRWPDDLGLLALAAEQAMAIARWDEARGLLAEGRRLAAGEAGAADPLGRGMVDLEALLFEVRLGRTDRALLLIDALLARPDLAPPLAAAALARKADLYLLAGRPADALAVADGAPTGLAGPDLALARLIARAWLPSAERDAALREELARATTAPGASFGSRLLALVTSVELALAAGDGAGADAGLAEIERPLAAREAAGAPALRERQWALALRARRDRLAGAPLADAHAIARTAFAALLREWQATPLLPGGVSFLRTGARRIVVHEAIATAPDDGAAFELLLEAQAMGSLARTLELPAPTLAEVRHEFLSRGELLLAWLPARESIHLFLVDATSVRRIDAPHDEPLPGPARDAIAHARLAWLTGAELLEGFDPIEALGADVPACELPSLPVALWLRRRPRVPRPARIDAHLGPAERPDGGGRFEIDRDRLARALPTLRFVDGDAASPAALLAALQGDVALLVAHGVVDRQRDRFAGLLLGRAADGAHAIAWADAFEAAPLPPFVVLAACSAGEAPTRVGEDGGEHLAGAALQGGARCVLLGRGELDAATVVPSLERVLGEIEAGASPADALWRDRRRPGTRRPFDRLALVGLGDEPLRPAAPHRAAGGASRTRWLGLAVALLGAGLLLLARSRRTGS